MEIIYYGKNQKILDAVDFINDLFQEEEFWKSITEKESFDYSKYSPSEIVGFMKDIKKEVEVKLYSPPLLRHRKTNGYTDPNYPNTLFYNSKKLWRNIGSIVNTIVHEYVHSVDFTEDNSFGVDFGHGSQSSKSKSNSAPYWIGDKAEMFYDAENSEAPIVESVSIDPKNIIVE